MKKILSKLLVVTLTITALAGCGSSTQNTETTTKPVSTSETQIDPSKTKVVKTANGDVTILANPQRIADISGVSDMLYILGMKPVATSDSDAYDHTKFPIYLEKELEGATIVGYPMTETVDIEGVLASKPDLIIINPRQEKIFEQLNQIATTIIIEPTVNDWRADLKMVAEIFDKTEIAEKYITDYNTNAKLIGEQLKATNGADTTYFSFLTAGSDYYLFTGAAYGDIFYNDMGLASPANMPPQDNISLPVATLEGLTEIDADFMLVLASDEDRATLESSTVWNNMRAVKENKIVWLSQSPYFNQAYSVYGKSKLLNELKDLLIVK